MDRAAAHTASAFIAQRMHSSALGLSPVLRRAQHPSVPEPADSRSGETDGEGKATGKGEVTARAEQRERSGERDGGRADTIVKEKRGGKRSPPDPN